MALVPFSFFLYAHHRGLVVKLFETAYRVAGIPGILCVPSVTLAMEKTIYDTVNCYQGKNKNVQPAGCVGAGFPSGGHLFPSFSLIEPRKAGPYYTPPAPRPASE